MADEERRDEEKELLVILDDIRLKYEQYIIETIEPGPRSRFSFKYFGHSSDFSHSLSVFESHYYSFFISISYSLTLCEKLSISYSSSHIQLRCEKCKAEEFWNYQSLSHFILRFLKPFVFIYHYFNDNK